MQLKTFEEMKKTSAFFMLKPVNAIYTFIITVCAVILAILIWAIFSPMDDVVKATVLLRPSQAVSSVKFVTSGELSVKNFENDNFVKSGDLLFSLDTTVFESELEAYQTELKKCEDEIFIYKTLLQTIKTNEYPALQETENAYLKSAAYLLEKERYETILKDAKIKLKREEEAPEMLKVMQVIEDLQNELKQTELSYKTWLHTQFINANDTLKQLQTSKRTIETNITELKRAIKNSTIYAPISGRITETKKVNQGDYILAGEEIIKIVPEDNQALIAELYVDPSYVARIKVGNGVKIKFPGLPPSRYGQIETEVSLVPPDVSLSPDGQPIFIVEAKIKDPYLKTKTGQTARLIPGITAEGRIITERSTVMQMVLRKLDFIAR